MTNNENGNLDINLNSDTDINLNTNSNINSDTNTDMFLNTNKNQNTNTSTGTDLNQTNQNLNNNFYNEAENTDTIPDDMHNINENSDRSYINTECNSEEPFITVKYNHKQSKISLKDAADMIQKNMYAQSSLEKLRFMAASQGTTLPDLVNNIFEQNEKNEINRIKELYADNDEEFLNALNKRREQNEDAFLKMLAKEDEPNLNERLADEFIELAEEFPECDNILDLPDEVIKEAAESEKSLLYCYLLYKNKEQQKLNAIAKKEEENLLSSAGNLSSSDTGGEDPVILAMLKGIRR